MAITLDGSNGITTDIASKESATFNRDTTDGELIILQKDNSTVGSIASDSNGRVIYNSENNAGYIGVNGTRRYYWTGTDLSPMTDGGPDLGASSFRFKDLYLSGGVYLGGTGAANYLDDYEEGTWTVYFRDGSGNVSSSTSTGRYTKIGDVVHFFLQIESISTTGLTNTGSDGEFTLPFTPDNTSTFPSVHMANVDFAADQTAFSGYVVSNSALVRVASIRDNNSGISLTVSQISGGNVRITGHYYAA